MNRLPHLTQRRAAQAVIWLVALLTVCFVAFTGVDAGPATVTGAHAVAGDPVFAAGESRGAGKDLAGNYFTAVEGIDADTAVQMVDGDTGQWLPAYRWQRHFQMQSQPDGGRFGMGNLDESLTAALSSFLFSIAGFVWWLLLGLTKWAFSTDLVEILGAKINATSAGLAASFGTSGLIAIVVLLVMVSVATTMFRNRGGQQAAVRNVAMFVVAIATMQVVTAAPAAERGDAGWDLSPVGIAERGSEVINDIVFQVTVPLTASPLAAAEKKAHEQPADVPNCEYYYARLYATYGNTVTKWENDKHEAALALVSRMWEATMLRSFTEAQYGVYEEGRYAVCHQLEAQRSTPREDQATIADGPNTPYAGMLDDGQNPFGEADEAEHQIAYYFAWMACRGYEYDEHWKGAAEHDRLEENDCEAWWDKGFNTDDSRFSSGSFAEDALTFDADGDEGPAAKLGGTGTTEYQVVSTFMAGEGRFSLAAASVITAVLYLVAIGGLALGTIVATVLLALLLVFSPLMLLLLALPSKTGQRNAIGVKMARMMGTTLLAKTTFYLSITVVVILINLLNGMVM